MLMEKKDPRVNSRGRVGGRRPSAVAGQDSARPQPLAVARVGWRRRGTVRWRGRPAVRAGLPAGCARAAKWQSAAWEIRRGEEHNPWQAG